MIYSDSHCHLDSYPKENLDSVFLKMLENNVGMVLNVGMTLEASEHSAEIAGQYDQVVAAVGIHPGMAIPLSSDLKTQLEKLSSKPKVAAIGEIGIEYHGPDGRPMNNIEIQKELFLYQLNLAGDLNLPVDIHYSMDAQEEIINIFQYKEYSGLKGIAHAFQGTLTDLEAWLNIGFYISVGAESLGIWRSIKKAPPLTPEVVRAIPADRLLIETDSMFHGKNHGPQKEQGKTALPPPPSELESRQPSDVLIVAKTIAEMRGVAVEEIGRFTTDNFKNLFRL